MYDLPDKRHQIGKELVEQRDTLTSLSSHTKGTSLAIGVKRSTRGGTLGQLLGDKVGVQHRRAIVGETLAQLDESDGVHAPLDLSRDTAQRAKLLLGGQLVVGRRVDGLHLAADVHGALGWDLGDAAGLGVDET